HAHARLRAVETKAAAGLPGVLAVFTGADVAADGLGTMKMTLKRKRPDGSPMFAPPHPGLVRDVARYVGDPVAMVAAETRAPAEGPYPLSPDVQNPNRVRTALPTNTFKVPNHPIRVIVGDVAAPSAPRAGNIRSTGWSCGPLASSGGP